MLQRWAATSPNFSCETLSLSSSPHCACGFARNFARPTHLCDGSFAAQETARPQPAKQPTSSYPPTPSPPSPAPPPMTATAFLNSSPHSPTSPLSPLTTDPPPSTLAASVALPILTSITAYAIPGDAHCHPPPALPWFRARRRTADDALGIIGGGRRVERSERARQEQVASVSPPSCSSLTYPVSNVAAWDAKLICAVTRAC